MNNIFSRLLAGETISFFDPDYQFIHEACAESKKLLVRLNNTVDTTEIKQLLQELFGNRMHETAVITPRGYRQPSELECCPRAYL